MPDAPVARGAHKLICTAHGCLEPRVVQFSLFVPRVMDAIYSEIIRVLRVPSGYSAGYSARSAQGLSQT